MWEKAGVGERPRAGGGDCSCFFGFWFVFINFWHTAQIETGGHIKRIVAMGWRGSPRSGIGGRGHPSPEPGAVARPISHGALFCFLQPSARHRAAPLECTERAGRGEHLSQSVTVSLSLSPHPKIARPFPFRSLNLSSSTPRFADATSQ